MSLSSIPLLKNINVKFNAEGHLMLSDKWRHGCAVFPTGWRQFALSATALDDDAWADDYFAGSCFAGSYCIGIIDIADIDHIHPASGGQVDEAHDMIEDVGCHYALSTGSFKLCGTDDGSWHTRRLFNKNEEDRVFPGSLTKGRTLEMEFSEGTLAYKLDLQSRSFNLASGERLLPSTWKFHKGKGGKGWPHAASGAGKGKTQSAVKSGKDADREPARFAPCIWLFAVTSSDHASALQVRLLDCKEGDVPPKRMRTLWDERRFSDCTIECGGEQIPAHRAVLCAASPVFSASFEGSMREAKEAHYSIGSCTEPQVVKAMLKFVYIGCLSDLNADELAQLLPLAVQYNLDGLCSIAAECLVNSLLSILKTNDDLLSESLV